MLNSSLCNPSGPTVKFKENEKRDNFFRLAKKLKKL